MVDSGSWYSSGYHWAHDGNPYESANFVIYSDAASVEARRQLAEIAEADGLGQPMSVIRDVTIDGGEGAAFAGSFEEKLGIGLNQYQHEFWQRIRAFLSE